MNNSLNRMIFAALCTICMALSLSACGSVQVGEQYEAVGPRVKIGVPLDQPALSVRSGTTYSGFNIDVATFIADQLGYAPWQIEWVDADPRAMGSMLADGSIDLAVGLYVAQSQLADIEQRAGLLLAGSYAADTSSVMVIDQSQSTTSITTPADIAGKSVCTVSAEDLSGISWPHSTRVLQQPSVMQCATALLTGSVDAVIAPRITLAGIERSGLQTNAARTDIAQTDQQRSTHNNRGTTQHSADSKSHTSPTTELPLAQVHVLDSQLDTGAYYVAIKPQAEALKQRIILAIEACHRSDVWTQSVAKLQQQTGLHIENTH